MRNLLLLSVAVLIFTACGNSHRHNENKQKEISNDSIKKVKVDSVVTTSVDEPSMDENFYSEMCNKKELKFESWKDSIIETCEGEGQNNYKLPVKIQHGNTQSFLFIITTSYEYYEKEDWERKEFEIQFKLRGEPAEGKTLQEDKKNRELYEWRQLSQSLADSLRALLPEPTYPKKFIHKGLEGWGSSLFFIIEKVIHININPIIKNPLLIREENQKKQIGSSEE